MFVIISQTERKKSVNMKSAIYVKIKRNIIIWKRK